jgi:hypothetical protein
MAVTRERLSTAIFLLLLTALLAVLAARAVRLVRHPRELDGIDEKKWFHSAGPVNLAADAFGSARRGLPQGAEVWLQVPPEWDPSWWGWMARYHLPEQRLAGVVQGAGAPAEAWVVEVLPEGKAVVHRRPR